MNELFGVSMTVIATVSAAITVGILLILAVLAWRNPVMFKLGLRNIPRRPAQTTLIILGLMLATLIMSAAFTTGDTLTKSVDSEVYDLLGPVDELVYWDAEEHPVPASEQLIPAEVVDNWQQQLDESGIAAGSLAFSEEAMPIRDTRTGLNAPFPHVIAFDLTKADAFGGINEIDGDASQLGPGTIAVNKSLADEIDAEVGDTVELYYGGVPNELTVVAIVQDSVLTGAFDPSAALGAVISQPQFEALTGLTDVYDGLMITNDGTTHGGVGRSDEIVTFFEGPDEDAHGGLIGDGPYFVQTIKADLLEMAQLLGNTFTTIFVIFGLFSIAAGVLLIFLIFVMLAAERKPEMGMARAVGARRRHLVESFLAEGMAYDLGSAIVGAVLGVGVAYLMVAFLNWFIGEDLGIDLQIAVTPRSFITAFCIGVIATFIVITIASVRASRLNIVAAIRDLPESRSINPEERTVFGYLRGVLNGLAAFGITVISLVLGLRFGSNPGLLTLFFATAAIGLIGPWIYVLRGHNFSSSRDERKENGGIPWWPVILGVATIPLMGLGLIILISYGLALLLVRFTRDRRPSRVPGWSMVLAIIVAPLGLIFAALQDRDRQISWSVGFGTVGLVLAVILFQWGLDANRSFQFFAAVSLMFLWAVVTLRYFGANERATFTIASAALLVLWYLPSDIYEKLFGELNGDAEMAFISGVVMVACGTFIIVYNADLLLAPLAKAGGRLGRFYPAVMTAIAYPLTARFRTGMTVAMIGLISFALVLFATFNSNFSQIFLNNDATGGFDDVVQVNSNNAIDDFEGTLAARGVDTAPIAAIGENRTADLSEVEVRDPSEPAGEEPASESWKRYSVIGADRAFLDTIDLGFEHRAAGYDSDEAIWSALAENGHMVVIPAALTQPNQGFGGPPIDDVLSLTDRDFPDGFEPFPLEFRDARGNVTELTVIGVVKTSGGTFWNGIIMPMPTFESIYPSVQAQSFYLTLNDGTDAKEYARTIEASLVQVSSDSLKSLLDDFRRQNTGFLYLFQGFMGLGLLVGIAALGVIAFRAVVERRQQIGMLRAIGYRRGMVALSFVVESAFIALSGILLGLVLGLSLSWVLFTFDSVTEGTEQAPFVVPWIELLVICVVAFGASLLMTFLPARSASRVAVAEALRYE